MPTEIAEIYGVNLKDERNGFTVMAVRVRSKQMYCCAKWSFVEESRQKYGRSAMERGWNHNHLHLLLVDWRNRLRDRLLHLHHEFHTQVGILLGPSSTTLDPRFLELASLKEEQPSGTPSCLASISYCIGMDHAVLPHDSVSDPLTTCCQRQRDACIDRSSTLCWSR